eukprot:6582196-Ditylum_brightwellii.AAC.1
MSATAARKHHCSAFGNRGGQGGPHISFGRGRGQGHFKTFSSSSRTDPCQAPSLPKIRLKEEDVVKKTHCDIQNNLI